jgi:hypothetical protein
MLRNIGEFCPPGTQISSPGGFCFDPSQIVSLEAYGGRNGKLVFHFVGGTTTIVTFYANVDGGPPDVYGMYRAVMKWRSNDDG